MDTAGKRFRAICAERGLDNVTAHVEIDGTDYELTHGAIAIAAVTSCTTATDQAMMIATALWPGNAAERGLVPAPWVKTILAPGSRATELLLERAGLTEPLRDLGFYTWRLRVHELHRALPPALGADGTPSRRLDGDVLPAPHFEGRIFAGRVPELPHAAGQRDRLRHRRHHGY